MIVLYQFIWYGSASHRLEYNLIVLNAPTQIICVERTNSFGSERKMGTFSYFIL